MVVAGTRSSHLPGPGNQAPEVRVPRLPADLPAHLQRDRLALVEADTPGEEGDDVGVVEGGEADTEIENVGALQEEGPLLREEEGEAREVGSPGVHLRFGEVGVHRGHGRGVVPEALEDVEARLEAPFPRFLLRRLSLPPPRRPAGW